MKVSIITPIYNSSKYLRKCLDSICNQTLREIEIICVDDGSEDDSIDIVQSYMQKDSRIKLLFHKHNGLGAAGARNMGLKSASGEYVLFLDSDDWFDTQLAEKAYEKAKASGTDIVLYDGYYYKEAENSIYYYDNRISDFRGLPIDHCFNWKDIKDMLFQISPGWVWNQLFRRQFLIDNHVQFQEVFHADDAYFSYTALILADKISYIKDRLVYYRYGRPEGQTSQIDKNPLSAPKFIIALRDFLLERNLYEELKRSFLVLGIGYCKGYLEGFYTVAAFEELYHYLKTTLYPLLLDEELGNNSGTRWSYVHCSKVLHMSPAEYLMDETLRLRGDSFLLPKGDILPEDRVVIYGAGNFGKAYFIRILSEKYCRLAGWVDENFKSIGFPVQSPQKILDLEFDRIIIAIENEKTAMEIKEKLINLGIPEKKIYWKKGYNVQEKRIEDNYKKIKEWEEESA